MINHLLKSLIPLFKTIGIFCLWFILSGMIMLAISQLQKEHYTPTDTPNVKFMVAVQSDDGEYYIAKNWQAFNGGNNQPYTVDDKDCIEDCLKKLENGNYVYLNEGAGYNSRSEYQIKDNKVIPISFLEYHIGTMVTAMFLAFLIISFLKYLHAIYQIRKDKTALIIYHKKLAKDLLIFVLIVGTVWSLMWWNEA